MKRFVILIVVVLVVVALWTGGWFFLSGEVRRNVEALALADGVTTPRLTCGGLNVTGFPFRFDVDCADARVVDGDAVIDVSGLRASVLVYRPTHILASARGPMTFTDAFTGSKSRLDWSGLEASLRLDGWRLARLSVSAHDLAWTDTLMSESLIAEAPLAELHLLDIPEQHDAERGLAALAVYGTVKGLNYPNLTIGAGDAEIELEATALPDDVRRLGEPDMLRRWQADGGNLRLVSIHGTDGDSDLTAEGNLALDASGQANGQVNIASTGVAERIGPLLAEPYRTLVLGNPAADGSYSNVLNFRAGGIYSGLIPIAAIPPLF